MFQTPSYKRFAPMQVWIFCTFLFFLFSCSTPEQGQNSQESAIDDNQTIASVENYPESLQKTLEAHGGLDHWRKMKRLSFEIAMEKGNEKHYIQLDDRRDRVEGSNFTMGYDGTNVWMDADTTYKGNPEFYHNLMFYFFAMPFVLADEGIIYGVADSLYFGDTSYPGVSISYEEGVGTSSKDEYFLYYHPETYQMAWLGYTVTYFSKETSQEIKWINYNDWIEVNGLKLPSAITWYKYERDLPTEPRNQVKFENLSLGLQPFPDKVFMKN